MTALHRQRRRIAARVLDVRDRAQLRKLSYLIEVMDPWDRRELMALRPAIGEVPLLAELTAVHASVAHLEAWLLHPDTGSETDEWPVAYAGAWRVAPHLASLAFFGRRGCRWYLPAIHAWLLARWRGFGAQHDIRLGEVKVLAGHPARRWLREAVFGEDMAELPGIGRWGDDFVQMIWRM